MAFRRTASRVSWRYGMPAAPSALVASVIVPSGVIMTYGVRCGPVPVCARLDYVRTPGVLRGRQPPQRRGFGHGAFFGRADDFWSGVTGFAFAFAFAFARPVVAARQ
jgi:hypothetical protein